MALMWTPRALTPVIAIMPCLALCSRSLATTPSQLCLDTDDPCIISDARVITRGPENPCPDPQNGCVVRLDFGARGLVVTSTGALLLQNDAVESRELHVMARTIQIDGRVDASGAEADAIVLEAAEALTVSASGRLLAEGEDSGGSIDLVAQTLSVSGQVFVRGTGGEGTGGSVTMLATGACDIAASVNASGPNEDAGEINVACHSVVATGGFTAVARFDAGDVSIDATGGHLQFLGTIDVHSTGAGDDAEDGSLGLSAETDVLIDTTTANALNAGREGDIDLIAERDLVIRARMRTGFANLVAGYDRDGRTTAGGPCYQPFGGTTVNLTCLRRFGSVTIRSGSELDGDMDAGGAQIGGCLAIQEADTLLRGDSVSYWIRDRLMIMAPQGNTPPATMIVDDDEGGFFVDFRSTAPDLSDACIKDAGRGCGSAAPVLQQRTSLLGCSCAEPGACDDGRPCSIESCDAALGCLRQIVADGSTCDDGDACTTNDQCESGACMFSLPRNCNDGNPCTADSCDSSSGCLHEIFTGPCNDGNVCTLNDVCSASGSCSGAPACGSGTIEPVCGEQCDGTNLGGATCQSRGFDGGALACFPPSHAQRCQFDTSLCRRCGNGMLEPGEVCDGSNLGGATCQSKGYSGGTLVCGAGCQTFDESGCYFCGNARIDPGEECDRENLGGATCNGPGETGGLPQCTLECRLDRTTCFTCGNGQVEPNEECDDGNVVAGDGCRADCRTECGNGSVEQNEECDDGNRTAGDGCSSQCARELPLGGGGARQDCALEWGIEGGQDSRRQRCTDGDPLCDRGTTPGRCDFLVFYCFNVAEFVVGEPAACVPRDIASVTLRSPSILGSSALSSSDIDGLLGAMGATLARGGATVSRSGPSLAASPPMSSRRQCGAFVLPVPLRTTSFGTARGRRVLSIEATDSAAVGDRDNFTFLCEP